MSCSRFELGLKYLAVPHESRERLGVRRGDLTTRVTTLPWGLLVMGDQESLTPFFRLLSFTPGFVLEIMTLSSPTGSIE